MPVSLGSQRREPTHSWSFRAERSLDGRRLERGGGGGSLCLSPVLLTGGKPAPGNGPRPTGLARLLPLSALAARSPKGGRRGVGLAPPLVQEGQEWLASLSLCTLPREEGWGDRVDTVPSPERENHGGSG